MQHSYVTKIPSTSLSNTQNIFILKLLLSHCAAARGERDTEEQMKTNKK